MNVDLQKITKEDRNTLETLLANTEIRVEGCTDFRDVSDFILEFNLLKDTYRVPLMMDIIFYFDGDSGEMYNAGVRIFPEELEAQRERFGYTK